MQISSHKCLLDIVLAVFFNCFPYTFLPKCEHDQQHYSKEDYNSVEEPHRPKEYHISEEGEHSACDGIGVLCRGQRISKDIGQEAEDSDDGLRKRISWVGWHEHVNEKQGKQPMEKINGRHPN